MLSDKTIKIVKSTVPLLKEGGVALITHFYKRMFSHNPEVLPFFNPANQASGAQPKALAAAVCAYAENIDNLGALGDAVELIAQKHVSLQIRADQYPIVGENLLESMKEVLGDVATDEVIAAWGEAYGFLADILINREQQIYDEQAKMSGGWPEFKKFKVVKKEKESDIITSFYFEPENAGALPLFKPGQYITIRAPSPCGHTTMRNYSLSCAPGQSYLRISVKREDGADKHTPKGYVSNLLHEAINVGDVLELAAPCGEFFLDMDGDQKQPLVLLAAGVGITPILSILTTALEQMPGREIIFIHASLDKKRQAFKSVIDTYATKYSNLKVHYRYSEGTDSQDSHMSAGFVDRALIDSMVGNRDAEYYFCGPKPFMVSIYHDLSAKKVPTSQMNFEFFGPKGELESVAA